MVLDWNMHAACGSCKLHPSLQASLGQLLSLQGRFWVFSARHACLSLLVPEATEYSQSRQSPVFALGPCALENIGNQSELGYKAVLLKLPLGGTG